MDYRMLTGVLLQKPDPPQSVIRPPRRRPLCDHAVVGSREVRWWRRQPWTQRSPLRGLRRRSELVMNGGCRYRGPDGEDEELGQDRGTGAKLLTKEEQRKGPNTLHDTTQPREHPFPAFTSACRSHGATARHERGSGEARARLTGPFSRRAFVAAQHQGAAAGPTRPAFLFLTLHYAPGDPRT